jgi:LysR family cys regulon transcriptional activator
VAELRKRYPKVQVVLHQGMPEQVARMLLDDVADIGLATESLAATTSLVTLPCYEWQHVMVVPAGTRWPRWSGRRWSNWPPSRWCCTTPRHRPHAHRPGLCARAAEAQGRAGGHRLRRHQDLRALGMGVGIVAETGGARTRPPEAATWWWRPLGHLFGPNVTRVAFKRGAYLRQFVYAFAELLSDRLAR